MKILLVSVNAKYIHTSLAVHSLREYAKVRGDIIIPYAEYTINQDIRSVLYDLYSHKADAYFFSLYIWNRDFTLLLIENLHKLLPNAQIFLGGPEATYNHSFLYEKLPFLTAVLLGEGEATFLEVVTALSVGKAIDSAIKGLQLYSGSTTPQPPINMDTLPFPYENLSSFPDRILYYESARGCPFSCSYCISSIDRGLRFKSLPLVYNDLQRFLAERPKQVKFVDRTFNANPKRARDIWQFLIQHDNGVTNFHFEIAADIFDVESIQLLASARSGLFQLEIGVQSINESTLESINRASNLERLHDNVSLLMKGDNIHLHLDLIAGLPHEDLASFKASFNWVYNLSPHQFQLGFLKVLGGSQMAVDANTYGIIYDNSPPYQVLKTNWLSYEELNILEGIEHMIDSFYNSGRFSYTLTRLISHFLSPYDFYLKLSQHYNATKADGPLSKLGYYELLGSFATYEGINLDTVLKGCCRLDIMLHEKPGNYPQWAAQTPDNHLRDLFWSFYNNESNIQTYLPEYSGMNGKQISRITHMELLPFNPKTFEEIPTIVLITYKTRNLLGKSSYITLTL